MEQMNWVCEIHDGIWDSHSSPLPLYVDRSHLQIYVRNARPTYSLFAIVVIIVSLFHIVLLIFYSFSSVSYFICRTIHHSLNDWNVMHSNWIHNTHKCSKISLIRWFRRIWVAFIALSHPPERKEAIKIYVTVTKHNLISFRFIRLYNFSSKNPPFTLTAMAVQHCCNTMANIGVAARCVWPTSERTFLWLNCVLVSVCAYTCRGGCCDALIHW